MHHPATPVGALATLARFLSGSSELEDAELLELEDELVDPPSASEGFPSSSACSRHSTLDATCSSFGSCKEFAGPRLTTAASSFSDGAGGSGGNSHCHLKARGASGTKQPDLMYPNTSSNSWTAGRPKSTLYKASELSVARTCLPKQARLKRLRPALDEARPLQAVRTDPWTPFRCIKR